MRLLPAQHTRAEEYIAKHGAENRRFETAAEANVVPPPRPTADR